MKKIKFNEIKFKIIPLKEFNKLVHEIEYTLNYKEQKFYLNPINKNIRFIKNIRDTYYAEVYFYEFPIIFFINDESYDINTIEVLFFEKYNNNNILTNNNIILKYYKFDFSNILHKKSKYFNDIFFSGKTQTIYNSTELINLIKFIYLDKQNIKEYYQKTIRDELFDLNFNYLK